MRARWMLVAVVVGVLGGASDVAAHAGVHERIAKVSAAIERSPEDATLYARRGVLWCEHGELSSASGDFRRARALAPGDTSHERKIARAWLRAEQPKRALWAIDRRLRAEPEDVRARWVRGVALADLEFTAWKVNKSLVFDFENMETPDAVQTNEWRNTLALRAGVEHRLKKLVLRGGAYFDPSPA
ncbi:MAG: hypothetical protein K0V04_31365, partial [Deltaproteobacteria bacterium]|nr:hypothetical protein [Deltaproteobacteria bacterium]